MTTYPSGVITPNQFRRLIQGQEPIISYRSWDGGAVFHLMGPLSPVIGVQEGVTISGDSIKGLIAPWQTLDQAGAHQDGVTFNDAVYNAAEIDMMVEAHGNNAFSTRRVIRDWVSAWDAHRTGELSVFTVENGMWWAPVRWLKAPMDTLMRTNAWRQRFLWTCRIDDAFWQSFDSISRFGIDSRTLTDTFNYGNANSTNLGANWPLRYYPADGQGVIYADGTQARWRDQPGLLTQSREVIAGPFKDYSTPGNRQVISITLGTIPEISLPTGAFNDIWGRMGRNGDGSWNGHGIRARIGPGYVELARFNGFNAQSVPIKTVLASRPLILSPVVGERFDLVCGFAEGDRLFKIFRNGVEILAHKEVGTGSSLGTAYRGVGLGMFAAGALITQATPASVRRFTAGENSATSQSGFVRLTNVGDVEAWPRYLLYGPGKFYLGNGDGSNDLVEFGPILSGQVVLIETEPRRRSVIDVSPSAQPAQNLTPFQELIKALVSFATNNNVPPLLREFENLFGILPPQANLYSLMNGRFSRPIEPKAAGTLGTTAAIKVRIEDGNANSRIVAALTPRRRWPL